MPIHILIALQTGALTAQLSDDRFGRYYSEHHCPESISCLIGGMKVSLSFGNWLWSLLVRWPQIILTRAQSSVSMYFTLGLIEGCEFVSNLPDDIQSRLHITTYEVWNWRWWPRGDARNQDGWSDRVCDWSHGVLMEASIQAACACYVMF